MTGCSPSAAPMAPALDANEEPGYLVGTLIKTNWSAPMLESFSEAFLRHIDGWRLVNNIIVGVASSGATWLFISISRRFSEKDHGLQMEKIGRLT